MNLKFNLTKALLLIIPLIAGWTLINFVPSLIINGNPGDQGSSSSSDSQSSASLQQVTKTVGVIDSPTSNTTALRRVTASGSITSGKIRIVATTRDPNSIKHGPFVGIGLIVVSFHNGEILRGNYIESEWIGNGKKILSASRSPGLLLPGQRRIYEYDLNSIPVSNNYDSAKNYFPAGKKEFRLLDELKKSPLFLSFYTSETGFGVIESVEISYEGSGTILLPK